MPKRDKTKYRRLIERLHEERQRMVDTSQNLLSQSMRDSLDELSLIDNHPADIGTEMYMRERDMGIRDRYKGQIAAIDAALKSWEEGHYGVCEHCGTEIPMERLELIPYTTVCTKCSREEEQEEQHTFYQESPEADILNHPFARSFQDEVYPVGFDGEDSWQAVAQYGTSDSLQDLGTNDDLSDPSYNYEDSFEVIGAVEDIDTLEVEEIDGTFFSTHHGRSTRSARVEE